MRILLLNQTFHPDCVATAQMLSELAVGLVRRGHEVTVVASRYGYDSIDQVFEREERWQGIRILRVSNTRLGKGAVWRRALDFASFLLNCSLRIVRLPRHDVVMALTSPPLISVLGAMRAWLWRGRFIYWIMDLNPDEALAAGWLRPGSLAARVLEWISRFSLNRAARVVALDRFVAARLLAKQVPASTIAVIPPWAHDTEVRFDPQGRDRFRRAHSLGDKYVVMYSGNHSPCHSLDTLLEAARAMADDDSVRFCFVGGGSEVRRVTQFAEAHRLRNIVQLPYQPLSELAGSLSAADVHTVVMGDAFVGIIHPCKIYNILAVGAPVLYIGPKESHIGDLFDRMPKNPAIAGVRHGDVAGAIEAIRRLRAVERQGQSADYASVSAEYASANLIRQFADLVGEG